MRQRRSSVSYRVRSLQCLAFVVALCAPTAASRAQGGFSAEGALFLLAPVGARAVGLGQAVVASDIGSESIWANPAGLARLTKNELSINHSQTIVATGDALNVVVPMGKAGVIAAAGYLMNYGQQEATDQSGATGTIFPRSYVIAASYASACRRSSTRTTA